MSELVLVALIVAGSCVTMALAMVAAHHLLWVRREGHLIQILDRFLSRSFEEYNVSDMIKKEIEIDQNEDADPDQDAEDKAVEEFMVRNQEALAKMGKVEVTN